MKVGELKGARNVLRIECTCSGIAIWIRYGNRAFDNTERRRFIARHADHELKHVQVRSTVC